MSCADSARRIVLEHAREIDREADRVGVLRSVDATETARWLREVSAALREACGPDDDQEPDSKGGGV